MNIRPWPEVQAALPRLSQVEKSLLVKSIERDGVLVPVMVLPDGRIIDGINRWELSNGKAPVEVVDLNEFAAFELALTLNEARRHLTPEQQGDVREARNRNREARRQQVAELRAEGVTQQQAAEVVGVTRQAVQQWEEGNEASDSEACIPSAPDHATDFDPLPHL